MISKNKKIIVRNIKPFISLTLVFLLILITNVSCSRSEKHETITQELISLVEKNSEMKTLLIKSIDKAKEVNPDKKTNPAQTLSEYYEFIDWAAKALPWNTLKDQSYPFIYEQIDQSLDYFYFMIDQPLTELEGRRLYRNSLQYYEPFRSWLIKFVKSWGAFLETEKSWNEEFYKKVYEDERFGLGKGWYEDPSNWKTFNQFFSRYLKSPDLRPISAPHDPAIVVSPADSVPQGVWGIDENSNIKDKNGVIIKSSVHYSIKELLGNESAYKDAFANSVLTHTFLDVQDYHRYHFPVGGTVKEINIIYQDDAVGGIIMWNKEKNKYVLDSETPGWQFIQTRGYVIVNTEKYGLVALIPVGMSQISSVNFEMKIRVGSTFKKGDMLGYFLFGGSDYIIIFQKNAGFKLTAPIENNSTTYKHILMGEVYGVLTGVK